ncbi:MAG TPA: LysM peptidoglycan-binding domain-containing protein [Firmicutes bacterium]|nr:LysM peptidoglycan-binding domain-containing protein [Bacillota bacterium]
MLHKTSIQLRAFLAYLVFIVLLIPLLQDTACSAAIPLGSRPLAYGARGDDVLELQYRLNLLGFYIKVLDGIFGSETRRAVIEFQAASNLPRTGEVDKATAELILEGKVRKITQRPTQAAPPVSKQQSKPGQTPKSVQSPKPPAKSATITPHHGVNSIAHGNPSANSNVASDKRAAKAGPAATVHVVKAGECLSVIGQLYGTSIEAIMKQNSLRSTTIYVGQKLAIPGPAGSTRGGTYEVRDGDCLFFIAKEFRTTVAAIAKANGLKDPNMIWPGQRLIIPSG